MTTCSLQFTHLGITCHRSAQPGGINELSLIGRMAYWCAILNFGGKGSDEFHWEGFYRKFEEGESKVVFLHNLARETTSKMSWLPRVVARARHCPVFWCECRRVQRKEGTLEIYESMVVGDLKICDCTGPLVSDQSFIRGSGRFFCCGCNVAEHLHQFWGHQQAKRFPDKYTPGYSTNM